MHPEAYKIYKEMYEFHQGTILLKELQLVVEGEEEDGSLLEGCGHRRKYENDRSE